MVLPPIDLLSKKREIHLQRKASKCQVMDNKTVEERSQNMAKIRSTNTRPEIIVRKELHRLGFRFRLHSKDLPGKPDLVFPKYKAVVFVNGCFWHGHEGCSRFVMPKSNQDYWVDKIKKNMKRDAENRRKLNSAGWRTLIVWECSLKKKNYRETIGKITEWLTSKRLDSSV